jgi:hypothetical protein
MSNHTWPSRGQQHFINDHIQKFRDARTSGTLATFYDEFYGNWFTRFLELNIVFPDVNAMDDLSKEDKDKLEWHMNMKKAVCIPQKKTKIMCSY